MGKTLDELPAGTRVGTSSLRRQALLLHLRPDLDIVMLRGNVETRLRKQRAGEVEATILAAAGLKRLGLMPARSHILDEQVFVPAVGQGALGIETRAEADVEALLRPLHHVETALAVTAERAFLGRMGGSCRTPLAALAIARTEGVTLTALIASPDGQVVLRGQEHGPPKPLSNWASGWLSSYWLRAETKSWRGWSRKPEGNGYADRGRCIWLEPGRVTPGC